VGGSAVGGLLGYGIFGSLRDKGWGPWKAGAATGLLGGLNYSMCFSWDEYCNGTTVNPVKSLGV